jgi:rod shape-determining protein MreC
MPLGTLDRTPPPFFRQGPSALTKLAFSAAFAVFLMAADNRFEIVRMLRALIATALHPVQTALLVPVQVGATSLEYAGGIAQARERTDAAERQLADQAERTARVGPLEAENVRLRALLELRPRISVRTVAAEVAYEAADPFSRRVVIDRGATHGVVLASPVVDHEGVLGQVTRLYPLTAEVTLLSDRQAAIPVLNARTQQRSVAFGGAGAGMELRFMAGNADVQVDDLLVTSGLDRIYPPGLPVAKVVQVERRGETGFARIDLQPTASLDGVRHVLVLEPLAQQLPAPPEAATTPSGTASAPQGAASAAAPQASVAAGGVAPAAAGVAAAAAAVSRAASRPVAAAAPEVSSPEIKAVPATAPASASAVKATARVPAKAPATKPPTAPQVSPAPPARGEGDG